MVNIDQKPVSYLFSKDALVTEAKDELTKIKEIEQEVNRNDLIYEINNKKKNKTYDFQKFKTIF